VPWRLTVRSGPRVTRTRFSDIDRALAALRSCVSDLVSQAPRRVVDVKIRTFEAGEQVTARLELAGPERVVPSVQAGIDVRGDGSTVAYLGRVRRRLIEPLGGEDSCAALAREVREKAG
jgi:hypothetical protein